MAMLQHAGIYCCTFLTVFSARAQNPVQYAGFGNNGLAVVENFGTVQDVLINDFVEHDNGKVVMFGQRTNPSTGTLFAQQFNADGSIDETFADNGRYMSPTPIPTMGARSAVALPGGKLLMLGVTAVNGAGAFHLFLLNPDGSLDLTYGEDGHAEFQANADPLIFDAVAAPDGSVFVGGYIGYQAIIMHVQADGTLDTSFGDGGLATPTPSSMTNSVISKLRIAPEGYLVAFGYRLESPICAWYITALDLTGQLIPWFGENGYRVIDELPSPLTEYSMNFALRADGSIIASGQRYHDGLYYTTYSAFNADGSTDLSFGNQGITEIPFPAGIYHRDNGVVSLLPDGDILFSGAQTGASGLDSQTRFVRLNSDGSFETAFGTNGVYMTHRSNALFNYAELGGLLANGKLAVAGHISTITASKHAIIVFDVSDINTSASSNLEAPNQVKIYPNPTVGAITISDPALTSASIVQLLDSRGRTVQSWAANEVMHGPLELDPALAAGHYTLAYFIDGTARHAPVHLQR